MEAIIRGNKIKGGKVEAPSSKSFSHRAIINASLSEKKSRIRNPLLSSDVYSTIRGCRAFGAFIERKEKALLIKGFGDEPRVPDDVVDLGNSGTSLRFFLGIGALLKDGFVVFTGDSSLRQRPNQPLINALNKLGGKVFSTKKNGSLPIVVGGKITGGEIEIDGSVSSQFISSLLTVLPLCEKNSFLETIGELKSKPYIDITLQVLNKSGIEISDDFKIMGGQSFNSLDYTVPGDYSSASNILVLGSLLGEGIIVKNLRENPIQGDAEILNILDKFGAKVNRKSEDEIKVTPADRIGFEVDLGNNPDLFPILAVLGSFVQEKVVLKNISHIRYKETDRVSVMKKELKKMGIKTKLINDNFVIEDSDPEGAKLDSHGDHRVVMALTVAALAAKGSSELSDAEAVTVSYPNFFGDLQDLGADIELRDREVNGNQ